MNGVPGHDLLALRLDDVGASTKRYEVYSKRSFGVGRVRVSGNWLFLKYLPGLKAWGPYRELEAADWYHVFDVLQRASASMTVAVTAAWAEAADRVTPFPRRFPAAAAALRDGVRQGLIEIANHGLTHCVLDRNRFRPHWFSSNREFHREFWEWVPARIHDEHVARAQAILQDYFQVPVVTFVPPGNVFTDDTLAAAERHGLRYVSCETPVRRRGALTILGNEDVEAFHDRDLVQNGVGWLTSLMAAHPGRRFGSVAALAQARASR
jgi:peptidoglycan/xylan/chitin deacetylase (PgdA/CDA1 family)